MVALFDCDQPHVACAVYRFQFSAANVLNFQFLFTKNCIHLRAIELAVEWVNVRAGAS